MEEKGKYERREIFSRTIRAGQRTYFFDVKTTRAGERFLTITESKRRFNEEEGKFFYEKHKLFLYKEDFDKFKDGFDDVIDFIVEDKPIPEPEHEPKKEKKEEVEKTIEPESSTDVEFEDLGKSDDVVE